MNLIFPATYIYESTWSWVNRMQLKRGDTTMSNIKTLKDLKPREVMKRASEGESWAVLYNVDSVYKRPDNQSFKNLCNCVANFIHVTIIDTSEPVIDWDKFDYKFFNQYGGLPVHNDGIEGWMHKAEDNYIFNVDGLVKSPFYHWQGGKCPVPDSVEVEIIYRTGVGHVAAAGECGWFTDMIAENNIIAFRLTGNVL